MTLATADRFILADDMGLGKTLQAIRAAQARPDLPGARLVVCPAIARPVWVKELRAEGIEATLIRKGSDIAGINLKGQVQPWVIISLPLYRDHVADLARRIGTVGLLIHDEGHQIKDTGSKSNKALSPVAWKAPVFWSLTGTPVKNHYGEMFALARLVVPHTVLQRHGVANLWDWEAAFCVKEKENIRRFNRKTRAVEMIQVTKITGSQNPQLLRQIMGPYMLRRTKKQVLKDLPALRWQALPVEINWVHGLSNSDLDAAIRAAEMGRAIPKPIATKRAELAVRMAPKAADIVKAHVEADPDPIIVFCNHLDALHLLQATLRDAGLRVGLITGETSPGTRSRLEAEFQSGQLDALLGQTLAMGMAITLTRANRVLFIDLAWSPADNAQARDRAHRIGQDQEVLAQYLIGNDPLSERVTSILARKTMDIENVMEHA